MTLKEEFINIHNKMVESGHLDFDSFVIKCAELAEKKLQEKDEEIKIAKNVLLIISMLTENTQPPFRNMTASRMGQLASEALEKMQALELKEIN